MKNEVLFVGRNGVNVAAVTRRADGELIFSYTHIDQPDYMISKAYLNTPSNHEVIRLCTEARDMGLKVMIPAPDYTGAEFDFTEKEFHKRITACEPLVEGVTVQLNTSEVFARQDADHGDCYCLVLRRDGVVVRIYQPVEKYATPWPSRDDLERFKVPKALQEEFFLQEKKYMERKRVERPSRRDVVIARLRELGIPFEE